MAPSNSKHALALLLAVTVALAATLQPSAAIRVRPSEPAATTSEKIAAASSTTDNGDVARPSTWPGFPSIPGLPQLPPLFPGFPPLLPLPSFPPLPPLPSFPPLPGCPPLPPMPALPGKPSPPPLPAASPPSSPASPAPPLPSSPSSPPASPAPRPPNSATTPPATPTPPAPPAECMSPLMRLTPCMGYLTNTSMAAPPTACCDGFKSLVADAPICLCHGMNGDINKIMPAPMDFMRMMSLPGTCGVPLPLQTLAQCSTQPVPPMTAAPSPPKPSR